LQLLLRRPRRAPRSTRFPYTTLFRSMQSVGFNALWPAETLAVRGYVEVLRHYREIAGIRKKLLGHVLKDKPDVFIGVDAPDFNLDRKSTRLNSSHVKISYAVFCLKKK